MSKKESKCEDGKTHFFMDNIPCEVMAYIREKASSNLRAISNEIILLIKEDMRKNEQA